MAELRFAGVRKDYGPVRALRGLDLEAADGELLVLVGPSGSGKSTALRTAAGLEDVTAGSVHIGERDVTRVPPAERNVAMVFQSYALFPHLSVAENIAFGLRARKVPREEARLKVERAAELVECGDLFERKPFELSGGERQRVALARALVREPDVFLLDEPLSNLDAQLRVHMRAELKLLHQRLGTTMVHVTHDQVEALTMGERVAVLGDGVVQQVATPAEVYRRPANRFVARFIGSPGMNLFRGRAENGTLHAGPFAIDWSSPQVRGRELEVGVRPEHVSVGGEGTAAEVRVVELAGSEAYLHLEVEQTTVVARVPPEQPPAVGSRVRVQLDPDRLHLFDHETGVRLEA